ncbi:MAG: deoxyribose-phosphate aldolase [Armatimonadetes bacterium]|nr:deoxyribose-phosphate aldolase [Armatimonadota bacterium]
MTAPQGSEILGLIDHSLLHPCATRQEVEDACRLGMRLGVAAVVVQPCWAGLAADILGDSSTRAASVVGFPLGVTTTEAKLMEALGLVQAGVGEVDMVINLGWVKSGQLDDAGHEIGAVKAVLRPAGLLLKVILEVGYLSDAEKAEAARMAAIAGADFVKTCTGFAPGQATVEDIRLLREAVPPGVGVKAAGGIRTAAQAQELVAAGANRLGTSATAAIARELGAEV